MNKTMQVLRAEHLALRGVADDHRYADLQRRRLVFAAPPVGGTNLLLGDQTWI